MSAKNIKLVTDEVAIIDNFLHCLTSTKPLAVLGDGTKFFPNHSNPLLLTQTEIAKKTDNQVGIFELIERHQSLADGRYLHIRLRNSAELIPNMNMPKMLSYFIDSKGMLELRNQIISAMRLIGLTSQERLKDFEAAFSEGNNNNTAPSRLQFELNPRIESQSNSLMGKIFEGDFANYITLEFSYSHALRTMTCTIRFCTRIWSNHEIGFRSNYNAMSYFEVPLSLLVSLVKETI